MFNPTNCNPLQIAGNAIEREGASSTLQVPFQATNCATLQFAPKFTATTSGKTSKANGASLAVKLGLSQCSAGLAGEHRERQSRTAKAAPVAAHDIAESVHGRAVRSEPRGVPRRVDHRARQSDHPDPTRPTGRPRLLCIHGGEAFPSLIVVLQGYGVTVDLVGTTFISKAGITSSTFKTVPDVPVGTFELTLPQGPYSALAANGNLCTSKLTMPTQFVAQNGMILNQKTAIGITGCPKTRTSRARKNSPKHSRCARRRRRSISVSCAKPRRVNTTGRSRRQRRGSTQTQIRDPCSTSIVMCRAGAVGATHAENTNIGGKTRCSQSYVNVLRSPTSD